MNKYEAEALRDAVNFASEAEEILKDEGIPGVSGIRADLDAIKRGDLRFGDVASRDFTIGDGVNVTTMLINLFMWIGQIRRGQFMKGATRSEIIQDLSVRVLNSDTLSSAAKERLLTKALDSLSDKNGC